MKRILCSRRMKACDRREIETRTPSEVLMEKAASAVYDVLKSDFDLSRVLFVCGGGNNGGDGLIAAKLCAFDGNETHILFCGSEDACTAETSRRLAEVKKAGVKFVSAIDEEYTAVVDAMFGIGLSREIDGENAEIINAINLSRAKVLSIDIPSGICADNGEILGCAVKADETVAIQAYKRGHLLGEGVENCGKLICVDIGISCSGAENFDGEGDIVPYVLAENDIQLLSKRKKDSNKGTYGRVAIIGGAPGMCGAVYLSALAAYRSGAGLVEIFTSNENRIPLQMLIPEAIVTTTDWDEPDTEKLEEVLERAKVVCVGPGMSMGKGALRILSTVYKNVSTSLIVDADALNLTAKYGLEYPLGVSTVITPHPLELSRLSGKTVEELKADLWQSAKTYADDNHVICVAKDHHTVIAHKTNVFVNASGTPALAKGGSGDVLCGVIAGLRCGGLSMLGASSLGVYIHGLAGEKAEEKFGMSAPLAHEVANLVGEVLREAGR